ncbi:hypothetical protein HDU79_002534 [Rhizoclosmatium sp. JEL0117]|nr:hypothetical protein HDU79_002534 [Rhizoclosmatium sp. JEL0117]
MASANNISLTDLIDLLIEEDSTQTLYDGTKLPHLADALQGRPASLKEIKLRSYETFAELQSDVETLLFHASKKYPKNADVSSAAQSIGALLRSAAVAFEPAQPPQFAPKYIVKDGDAFGEQKVSLARRNNDGSLLFTNAYCGSNLPEDFYRVSEIDEHLTPIFIQPALELSKAQIPELGTVSRHDGVKQSKRRIQGITVNSPVDFVEYSPYQSFAPQSDSSHSLISVKETIQMYKPRRNLQSSKFSSKDLPFSLGDFEPTNNTLDINTARSLLVAGQILPEHADIDKALQNLADSNDKIADHLTIAAIYNLNALQDQKIVKKTMGLKADQDKLFSKIQNSLLHSVLKSKSKTVSKGDIVAAAVRHETAFEPVFKGMLHQTRMK